MDIPNIVDAFVKDTVCYYNKETTGPLHERLSLMERWRGELLGQENEHLRLLYLQELNHPLNWLKTLFHPVEGILTPLPACTDGDRVCGVYGWKFLWKYKAHYVKGNQHLMRAYHAPSLPLGVLPYTIRVRTRFSHHS